MHARSLALDSKPASVLDSGIYIDPDLAEHAQSRRARGERGRKERTVIPQAILGVQQHVRPPPALLPAASSGLHTVRAELNW